MVDADPHPVALVTGAARRIGAAVARTLHRAGWRVAIHHHRSGVEAAALVAELEAARAGSAAAFAADLLLDHAPEELVTRVIDHFGAIELLVNNASTFRPTPLGHIDRATFDDLLGTNLRAPLMLAQAARAALAETGGSIVNLVDVYGERALGGHAVYGAAKAGLIMLTRVLALDLAPRVRVNAVAPGAILWREAHHHAATRERVLAHTALARRGDPEDVAAAVLFLARDARYTTGAVIPVDGGRLD